MTIQGLDKLKAKLNAMPNETRTAIKTALNESADELLDFQRRLVPIDEGDLRDSLIKREGKHDLAVEVAAGGRNAFYARFVEFGTVKRAAQPFFFPAYRALRRKLRGRISRAVTKAAKKVAGSG